MVSGQFLFDRPHVSFEGLIGFDGKYGKYWVRQVDFCSRWITFSDLCGKVPEEVRNAIRAKQLDLDKINQRLKVFCKKWGFPLLGDGGSVHSYGLVNYGPESVLLRKLPDAELLKEIGIPLAGHVCVCTGQIDVQLAGQDKIPPEVRKSICRLDPDYITRTLHWAGYLKPGQEVKHHNFLEVPGYGAIQFFYK